MSKQGREFLKLLYAYKGPKPEAKSAFAGVNQSNVSLGGLVNANASKSGNSLTSSATPSSALAGVQDATLSGLESNLTALGQSPTQQLQDLQAGNNTFFNLADEINRRSAETALSQAQARFSANGLENSSVRGAFEGQIANDAILRDLATQQSSIQTQNALAGTNAQIGGGILGTIGNLLSVPLQVANNNLNTALRDQTAASIANAQIQSQGQTSVLGSLLSGAGTLAGIAAAPFTGGASLALAPAATSVTGSLLGANPGNQFTNIGGFGGLAQPLTPQASINPISGATNNFLNVPSFTGRVFG